MGLGKFLLQFTRTQAKNVFFLLKGIPLWKTPLGGMTIDAEDVSLAQSLLKNPVDNDSKVIQAFESEFAVWNGSKYAFSFISGRASLTAGIKALGLTEGDHAVVPGYTCVVVPNAFWFEGVEVSFCDIELDTYGLDWESFLKVVKPGTKAVVIHHLFGLISRDHEKIIAYCREKGIAVIEDCAHALGSTYRGVKAGNAGDLAFFSLEQSKSITTFQGGIVVTKSEALANKLKDIQVRCEFPEAERTSTILKNFILKYYTQRHRWKFLIKDWWNYKLGKHKIITTNEQETGFQKPAGYFRRYPAALAQLARQQLQKATKYAVSRHQGGLKWEKWAEEKGFITPVVIADSHPAYLRYPILVPQDKKENVQWARSLNADIGKWFVSNLHPAEYKVDDCPNAQVAIDRCLNLPTLLKEEGV